MFDSPNAYKFVGFNDLSLLLPVKRVLSFAKIDFIKVDLLNDFSASSSLLLSKSLNSILLAIFELSSSHFFITLFFIGLFFERLKAHNIFFSSNK